MPLDGNLLKVTRLSDCSYDTDDILDVVFTNLVVPDRCTFNTVKFRMFNILHHLYCKILIE